MLLLKMSRRLSNVARPTVIRFSTMISWFISLMLKCCSRYIWYYVFFIRSLLTDIIVSSSVKLPTMQSARCHAVCLCMWMRVYMHACMHHFDLLRHHNLFNELVWSQVVFTFVSSTAMILFFASATASYLPATLICGSTKQRIQN